MLEICENRIATRSVHALHTAQEFTRTRCRYPIYPTRIQSATLYGLANNQRKLHPNLLYPKRRHGDSIYRRLWRCGNMAFSPIHVYLNPSFSSPLFSPITPSLFYSNLKTYLLVNLFRYRALTSNHSSFLTPTAVSGRRPLPSEICAQIDPPPSKNADYDRFPLITSQS